MVRILPFFRFRQFTHHPPKNITWWGRSLWGWCMVGGSPMIKHEKTTPQRPNYCLKTCPKIVCMSTSACFLEHYQGIGGTRSKAVATRHGHDGGPRQDSGLPEWLWGREHPSRVAVGTAKHAEASAQKSKLWPHLLTLVCNPPPTLYKIRDRPFLRQKATLFGGRPRTHLNNPLWVLNPPPLIRLTEGSEIAREMGLSGAPQKSI